MGGQNLYENHDRFYCINKLFMTYSPQKLLREDVSFQQEKK